MLWLNFRGACREGTEKRRERCRAEKQVECCVLAHSLLLTLTLSFFVRLHKLSPAFVYHTPSTRGTPSQRHSSQRPCTESTHHPNPLDQLGVQHKEWKPLPGKR